MSIRKITIQYGSGNNVKNVDYVDYSQARDDLTRLKDVLEWHFVGIDPELESITNVDDLTIAAEKRYQVNIYIHEA